MKNILFFLLFSLAYNVQAQHIISNNLVPNPANDYIIAEYTIEKTAKSVLLVISDMQGRLQIKYELTNKINQSLIDIRNLLNGTYNCAIIVDGLQKAVKKLIIQH